MRSSRTEVRSRWILGAVAVFAMAWAVTRAAVQSITIDESVTYNVFVFQRIYLQYAANNHILNSTLMYGFTKWLGLSQFTARLPALIGAGLYIAAAYRLCRLLGVSLFVQLTVFVCLVFNPFIFDYLVAARGYGLALGFLMWAIVYSAESHMQERSLVVACAVSSACSGMSVNANLSFAFVNLVAMAVILFCALYRRPNQWVSVLAACTLPGAAVTAIVSGYALTHWRPGELIYGAKSLGETFATIIAASLFQTRFVFLKPLVFPLVGVTGLIWLSYLIVSRTKAKIARFGGAAAALFAVTVVLHWMAFRLFGILLPKDRTAIYLFPLFMIVAGVLAAIPPPSVLGRNLRACFIGALALMATYFLLCLRLTYFKEWQWDADVQNTYAVLTCLNREHQVTHVASTWEYRGPLNFYQLAEPNSIQEIDDKFDPQQTQVYVVDTYHSRDELQGKNLKIFYRSPITDLALAASPPLADDYVAGVCFRL
ncbi:MAG: hypothetical protein JWO19_164 [Bryobacterales bacterium]|nr:hypothetical protein [Bryobacterales bacterium]